MKPIVVIRSIAASPTTVFRTVADIREMSRAVPHIVAYEFLTTQTSGVGTRFRETRRRGTKDFVTELEVTEYEAGSQTRMVADSHGVIWDTRFEVTAGGGACELRVTMEARPHKLMPRIMLPLTRGMIEKAMGEDMDLVKAFCEQADDSSADAQA